ncbi:DUF551 domain-containing protein [Salmonella enterica subsp. enterica serovar Goverdhan]|nr:DUF551 domain-containing protein [Salmonella enterica subsp. enterica serovar Goverdhan]EDT8794848.1 DUF551 domain-containing protein [Salmonella enterica subsp. enterica]EKO5066077.1 DUF551 domain-containing protein [Salmonella enterica]EBU7061091.1 DUF551 domain-containing protein [Salmonella enterica subsp. enterica serovar Goverdhan]ECD2895780.1 DUF551 domain-containing protein [Salmonella enterica subsp. enterica serovar Goverdhan]
MTTITKERIELFIKNPLENGLTRGEQMELARIALASLTAEPAPVVPGERPSLNNGIVGFDEGWNACRAAMLQGVEPVSQTYKLNELSGNYPVTPDTWIPVSERMPEASGRYWCYVEEQNCLGKSHYQWNCSWNGERWWVESDNGGRVTHWMPLPAVPRQEVK